MKKFRDNMDVADIMESVWWKYADKEIRYTNVHKLNKPKLEIENRTILANEMNDAPPKSELEKIYGLTEDLRETANHYKTTTCRIKKWMEIYGIQRKFH